MRPLEPVPFFLLREVLPELAGELKSSLRRLGHATLAEQVRDLRIYGRCPCDGAHCGTFYCVPPESYSRLARLGVDMDCMTVAQDTIIRVETLDPAVNTILKQLFPNTDEVR